MSKKHPSRSFHLVINEHTRIPIYETTKGRGRYTYVVLKPDFDYSLDDEPVLGNEDFINSLRKYEIKKTYDPRLEEKLKLLGIKYRTEMCKSCGGRIKKIFYKPVEIIEWNLPL